MINQEQKAIDSEPTRRKNEMRYYLFLKQHTTMLSGT